MNDSDDNGSGESGKREAGFSASPDLGADLLHGTLSEQQPSLQTVVQRRPSILLNWLDYLMSLQYSVISSLETRKGKFAQDLLDVSTQHGTSYY